MPLLRAADLYPAGPVEAGVYAQAQSVLEQLLADEALVGAALTVVWPGQAPWSLARGDAVLDTHTAFTAATPTAQHELAQLFTAVAVLQLVEAGLVDLDQAFSNYLPQFQPFAGTLPPDFTVRQLLSHHSGLPAYYAPGSGFARFEANGDPQAWREVLGHSADISLVSRPGQVYEYSYLGYDLLGLLIEHLSGEPYEAYISRHILAPLQLHQTYFSADPDTVAGIALAYADGRAAAHERLRDLPAAGLVSSVDDMGRFLQALLRGGDGLLNPASVAQLFTVHNASVYDDNFEFGLGFFVSPATGGAFRDLASVSHAATNGATRTYLSAFPGQGLGLVLTTNSELSSVKLRDAADQIMAYMLKIHGDSEGEPYLPHAPLVHEAVNASALMGAYSGPGGTYYVENKRGNLRLNVPFLPFLRVNLLPRVDGYFGVEIRLLGLNIGRLSQLQLLSDSLEGKRLTIEGRELWYWYWRGVAAVTLTQIVPAAPGAARADWQLRAGDYESEVSGAVYRLAFDRDSGNFSFGLVRRGLGRLGLAPELHCLVSSTELRTCSLGLVGTGSRSNLRALDAGRLVDAFGVHYRPH